MKRSFKSTRKDDGAREVMGAPPSKVTCVQNAPHGDGSAPMGSTSASRSNEALSGQADHAGDWAMTPELANAMGLGGGEPCTQPSTAAPTGRHEELGKHTFASVQRQRSDDDELKVWKDSSAPAQTKPASEPRRNSTGLPDNLKSGIETLSGIAMDDVNVHYNSSQPAQLNALAYTQGRDVHVAPGQEQHLPHEAWHVVQQAQGRVLPTMQMKDGVPGNDDQGLEHEADVMGAKALEPRHHEDTKQEEGDEATGAVQQTRATGDAFQMHGLALGASGQKGRSNYLSIQPGSHVVQRLPSPPDADVFRPGLSPIGPIYKNQYKGDASTTISSGWCMGSFERRWRLYDATDTLLDESTYTNPSPTYTVPVHAVLAGKAGGSSKPWSVWITVTKTLVPFGGDNPDNFPHSFVTFPVYNTAADESSERDTGEDDGFGVAIPKGGSPTRAANTNVSPDVALRIIENYAKGEPPFKPELGKGGASWFVVEGEPYTGIAPSKSIDVAVELVPSAGQLRFDEAQMNQILNEESQRTAAEAEVKYRELKGLDRDSPLSSKMRKGLVRFQERFAESRMWDRVGEMVRNSDAKAGEVVLQEGGKFSKTPGKFAVVADASKVRLKGGIAPLVETLNRAGVSAEPVVLEAATKLATKQAWAGRVRGAFRYGGKILLVVAITQDFYKIYSAEDKLKTTITSLGGWAGATAAGAAFAAWFTPADTAGPWAWAAHGVGTLAAGGIGYWFGSETTRYIYELVPIGDISKTEAH